MINLLMAFGFSARQQTGGKTVEMQSCARCGRERALDGSRHVEFGVPRSGRAPREHREIAPTQSISRWAALPTRRHR